MHHSRLCAVLSDCGVDDVGGAGSLWGGGPGRAVAEAPSTASRPPSRVNGGGFGEAALLWLTNPWTEFASALRLAIYHAIYGPVASRSGCRGARRTAPDPAFAPWPPTGSPCDP